MQPHSHRHLRRRYRNTLRDVLLVGLSTFLVVLLVSLINSCQERTSLKIKQEIKEDKDKGKGLRIEIPMDKQRKIDRGVKKLFRLF